MYRQIWLKSVLVTFWTIEMIWLLATFILSCLQAPAYSYYGYSGYSRGGLGSVVAIILTFISMGLNIAAIVLYAVKKYELKPVMYLIFQCIKMPCWLYYFIATFYGMGVFYFYVQFALSIPLLCTALGQLIYAAVVMSRLRRGLIGTETSKGYDPPPRGSYAGWNPNGAPDKTPKLSIPTRNESPVASGSSSMRPIQTDGASSQHQYEPDAAQHSYELQGIAPKTA